MQLVLIEAATAEEVCEDEREDRVAVVVLAIDLLAALGEVPFQLPEAGRLLNLRSLGFSFQDDRLQLPRKRLIEGASGDGLLRRRSFQVSHRSAGA